RVRGRVTAPTDLLVTGQEGGEWRLRSSGTGLQASGSLELDVGPATITLGADRPSATPTVALHLASTPSLAAKTTLTGSDLLALVAGVAGDGLVFTGEGSARGAVVVSVQPEPRAVLQDFGVQVGGFDVEADGTITAAATDLPGRLVLPGEIPTATVAGQLSLP